MPLLTMCTSSWPTLCRAAGQASHAYWPGLVGTYRTKQHHVHSRLIHLTQSNMVLARKWVINKAVKGVPTQDNFRVEEEQLPTLKNGEILIQAQYVSVDPYLRGRAAALPVGATMDGNQVGKVIETRSKDYDVGELVLAHCGWRSHTIITPNIAEFMGIKVTPELLKGDLSTSLALGVVGMPGATAYFGLLSIGEAKAGDVVYVNAAAGAVGSVVGQIAKIKGCKVIGSAGSEKKCAWLRNVGFDHVLNYKTQDILKELKNVAPEGIDCFFDNVGGELTMQIVADQMRPFGRVAICGSISGYNDTTPQKISYPIASIIYKQIKMHGFLGTNFFEQYDKAFKDITQWIIEGKIKYEEHMTKGFKNIPKTWFGLFTGENIGKAIIKIEQ